jgi:hypothetical protein
MNIDEQFENLLANLGVEMERPNERDDRRQDNADSIAEVSIFQASREHYGVFYRLDMIDDAPELRIMVPAERGHTRMDIYLVRLSEHMPLTISFAELATYQGSTAYEQGRDAALQHMLYAVAEMMKQLFWSGDTQRLSFPPEIEVYPLLLSDDRRMRRLR